ncbi:unnamed protein product [Bursaphelenchus xylophilus]|uniref:(pine wood nematode) hypothetical protein n=1 Tax=Bursaphelenchus xylophilus TaxID=6326 RepID=A0A1I7S761_BURXY|nr:unnamed protein product [Bursaphelenchus xylophilus]CAG9084652.1 unnamed protein product [Bursaphelenchus xylophilus]
MYASKRRQRNFKRVREAGKQDGPTNPSKRHRERLNGELETVAALLPFDENTLQRLDKLSVLRLAVSYLQIKAHFQVCSANFPHQTCPFHPYGFPRIQLGPIPSIIETRTGSIFVDPLEPSFSQIALRALGGFVIVMSIQGEILYASENIELFLGLLQSDILHQPVFEMIHSEDRDDIKEGLKKDIALSGESLEKVMVARFRSLLDNTCGFIRVELRGRFTELHSAGTSSAHSVNAFLAVCTPFVPPIQTELPTEDPILKSKHSLDLTVICLDSKLSSLLEIGDNGVANQSFYNYVHPEDAQYVSDAHRAVVKNTSSGLMIYRLMGQVTGRIVYVQSSLRTFFKTNKAESIGGTHRTLSEVDGVALLEKRATMKSTYLTFDDTLLQSPRQISCIASLNPCSRSAPPRELKISKPGTINGANHQSELPPVHLPMLSINPTHLAENSVFFHQPLLPITIDGGPQQDFNGLAAMIPNPVQENDLLWQQALKPSLDAAYSEIAPSCYYPHAYMDPSSQQDLSGVHEYYHPHPHLLPNPSQLAKTYETTASTESSFVGANAVRYCDPNGFDPGFSASSAPDFNQPTNNFTFFTEVAHILGNS